MVCALQAFLDFCYLAHRDVLDTKSLVAMQDASSITESKHIKAVKKPYRQSGHYQALGHMLLINKHLHKLMASQVDFQRCGMLKGTCLSNVLWLVHKLGGSITCTYIIVTDLLLYSL